MPVPSCSIEAGLTQLEQCWRSTGVNYIIISTGPAARPEISKPACDKELNVSEALHHLLNVACGSRKILGKCLHASAAWPQGPTDFICCTNQPAITCDYQPLRSSKTACSACSLLLRRPGCLSSSSKYDVHHHQLACWNGSVLRSAGLYTIIQQDAFANQEASQKPHKCIG